jgi:hypothetical protein
MHGDQENDKAMNKLSLEVSKLSDIPYFCVNIYFKGSGFIIGGVTCSLPQLAHEHHK